MHSNERDNGQERQDISVFISRKLDRNSKKNNILFTTVYILNMIKDSQLKQNY